MLTERSVGIVGGQQRSPVPGKPPTLKTCVEWRPLLWVPAVEAALSMSSDVLRPGATVLEVGYNSGMMSAYLAATYGVRVVGYETTPSAQRAAIANSKRFGVQHLVDFRVCRPDQTLDISGSYDAAFVKSVLYHIQDKHLYRRWLQWLHSVLRPGGVLMAVENGQGGPAIRWYRCHIARSRYAQFCLVNAERLEDFRAIFARLEARFFGRVSPFFEPIPLVRSLLPNLERVVLRPNVNHHFVAAITAWREIEE